MQIIITKEDYRNSSGNYIDDEDCPLATAVKRIFKQEGISLEGLSVGVDTIWTEQSVFSVQPEFSALNFEQLVNGHEFTTDITLIPR